MDPHKHSESPVLVVDDEESIRNLLYEILSDEYVCVTAASAEEALRRFDDHPFGLVLSDINLGGMTGVEMIPFVRRRSPDTVVMMISGSQTIDTAIHAMRVGAFDYIRKPFNVDHVLAAVKRAIMHHSLLVSKREHEEELERLVQERTAQLEFLTLHDSLTGLPNRLLVEDRLEQLVMKNLDGGSVATVLIAMDRVHFIRDTLGAFVADELVSKAAERIVSQSCDDSTVGRIEGEIFAVLCPETSPEEIVPFTGRLLAALEEGFSVGGRELFLRPSLGISFSPADGQYARELLRNAGLALSQAREVSGPAARFYTAAINEFANRRFAFENDLRRAIELEQFEVHYQPKLSTATGLVTGAEALLRWMHPERGLIGPAEFVEVAESIGLIGRIGEWVLRRACEDLAALGGSALTVAVNISPFQLREPGIAESVGLILEESGLQPARLELEVTETSVMHNAAVAISELETLRGMGVKISLDDFGTGYSSLNALKDLPVDALKIDRRFISDAPVNPRDAACVKTIIDLAENLGLGVVAEGVEFEEQLELLRELKCKEWQGFLFSRPVPFAKFRLLDLGSRVSTP